MSEGTPANLERGVAERRAARTQPTIQLNQLFVRHSQPYFVPKARNYFFVIHSVIIYSLWVFETYELFKKIKK